MRIYISISYSNVCEYILKPKDIYSHRPLPPIIGSEEWYQKWHLDIPSSDSDTDGVSDIYSESDSEDNLPKDLVSTFCHILCYFAKKHKVVLLLSVPKGRVLYFSK